MCFECVFGTDLATALLDICLLQTLALCVYVFRAELGNVFCISWLLTWFGHVLSDIESILRIFDFFIACHPLMPVYVMGAVSCSCLALFSQLCIQFWTNTSTWLYLIMLFGGCLMSQQHASVSQGRICSDNFTCCHTEIEVADQTFHLTQSQYTDTGPTSPSTDPIMPGAWQGSYWSAKF